MQLHNIIEHIKLNIKLAVLLGLLTLFNPCTASAQAPPPPPNNGHGYDGNQQPGNGGDAPLGSGLALLVAFAGLYACTANHRNER